ncbi:MULTISPECIES: ABC transporter ATP-binding protein [unclassified Burkholderia]|uniref:ABC transporter ATP-binding protein n=1 Tax=unclassified Burkholderia TaxID=2613784 RepID=UPI00084C3855|nr:MULTISPECIES: ABC transporter ATP-binding protein [unclassified Burkholderia]RQU04883.1 ABC transporter ATP-binding protein [Burkholderia cenocepacia]MBR8239288.1 ABC transporter ATP-binding protein [Burkholderia sp. AU32357]MBY4877003.1 ABC transporter ATP-binding protein [Burkholderia sp. AU42008]OED10302.1 ABC transporter [Burkholderia sp. A2]OXI38553.1 ABC transporter ATP-binding protein [Burkholderia sp. AU17457]
MNAVILEAVEKSYLMGSVNVTALRDVTLDIRDGKLTVIAGASGSGKSTLLNLVGCVDRPDRGRIVVAGEEVGRLSDDALSDFRARRLGFVFQNFNLLPVLTAHENVEYPLLLAGTRLTESERALKVRDMLDAVGLADKAHHRPGQMSGGQRQRVAIARALVASPNLVLADEPTANLDSKTGQQIIALMRRLQRERRVSFVISSHDPQVIAAGDDVVHIADGIVSDVTRTDDQEAFA